ncbi:MAG: orotidine-5'-phosphate decarboxylase [Armatimonadota bacterium]
MDVARSFLHRLEEAWNATGSLLCVGLDPDLSRLPEPFGAARADPTLAPRAVLEFGCQIIEAVRTYACALKPQYAYYAALGPDGIRVLQETVRFARQAAPELVIILDGKRADIGSTSSMYAVEAFDVLGCDAVTVNPYMGRDAVEPFLLWAGKGAFVLCRTSNPGAGEVQDLEVQTANGPCPLYQVIARMVAEKWNKRRNCGLVVGATRPEELARVREIAPDLPILIPGVGVQGGDLEAAVRAGLDAHRRGVLVNASRSIIYANGSDHYAHHAGRAARDLRDAINRIRGNA